MPVRLYQLSLAVAAIAITFGASAECSAAYVYVDNRLGSDAFDGSISEPGGANTGPVKTIMRGLELAKTGDTVDIRNTGIPYYESIVLFGPRHSGYPTSRFIVEGNGAIIDGSMPVPSDAWKELPDRIWKITPYRKGWYSLLKGYAALPQVEVATDATELPKLADGQWCAWKGSIYFKGAPQEYPPQEQFRFAARGMGLTLYRIHDTEVRNLIFQNFRVDGVNAPDLCDAVILDGVTSTSNGRSGLFVGGSATVSANRSDFTQNGQHELLTRAKGRIDLKESKAAEPAEQIE